jgi:Mn-containing catalase
MIRTFCMKVAATINMLNGHAPDAKNATIGNIEAHVLTGLKLNNQ